MNLTSFVIIFASVSLSALAQTSFKIGVERVRWGADASILGKSLAMLLSPYVIGGLALYGVGTILWLFALRQLELSVAYPFVAMSFVMVLASGVFFLGEPLSAGRIIGVCLIVSGLVVISRST